MLQTARDEKQRSVAPNFIYVGAPKSGSTWLFEALREHPQVFVAPGKSTEYFETEAPGPLAEYLKHFERAGDALAVGEIAHDVFVVPGSAKRIRTLFPQMRILFCLREPGDFAASALRWWTTHTHRYGNTATEMAQSERFITLVDYSARLAPFYEVFPREQIKVVFFEDLRDDPAVFIRSVQEFLGVDAGFRPQLLDKVVNRSHPPRNKLLTHSAFVLGGILRRAGFGGFVERVKHMPIVEKILYDEQSSDFDSEIERIAAGVRIDSRPMLDKLEALIGTPLPDYWRKG